MRLDRHCRRHCARPMSSAQGFATNLPGGVTAFLKTRRERPLPDIQLLFIAAPLTAAPYLPPFSTAVCRRRRRRVVLLLRRVAASSGSPRPIRATRPASSRTPCERAGMAHDSRRHAAVSRTRARVRAARLSSRRRSEPAPRDSDDAIDAHIRGTAIRRITRSARAAWAPTPWRWSTGAAGVGTRGCASSTRRSFPTRRRQHQRAGRHDRREGGRPDPRPRAVAAGAGVAATAARSRGYPSRTFNVS